MKKIEKIVILNDRASVDGGTSELALLHLELARKKNFKTVFLAGESGPRKEPVCGSGEAINIGSKNINPAFPLQGMIPGLWNRKALDTIRTWIRTNDTPNTIYHLHGWSKNLSPAVFSALRPVANRAFFHAHDFFMTCPNGAIYNFQSHTFCNYCGGSRQCFLSQCDSRNVVYKYWRFLRHKIFESQIKNFSGTIVLIHEKMRPNFLKNGFPESQCFVVKNPAVPFTIKRVPAENNQAFIFIGRVSQEKGCLEFLSAAEKCSVPTTVIGSGYQERQLQQRFPSTKFVGWRSKNEIKEIIEQARCVVMPTLYPEPFGLVAVEAVASGIPVLISSTAFLAENIHEIQVGLAFSHHVHHDLEKKIAILKEDSHFVKKLSQNGFSRWPALANTPEAWFQQLENLYLNQIV